MKSNVDYLEINTTDVSFPLLLVQDILFDIPGLKTKYVRVFSPEWNFCSKRDVKLDYFTVEIKKSLYDVNNKSYPPYSFLSF